MKQICPKCEREITKTDLVIEKQGIKTYKCTNCSLWFELSGFSSTQEKLKTIEEVTESVLSRNRDLRTLKYRKIVAQLVEDKISRELSAETVPRAIRKIQNTNNLFLPDEQDKRVELEQEYKEFYSR